MKKQYETIPQNSFEMRLECAALRITHVVCLSNQKLVTIMSDVF